MPGAPRGHQIPSPSIPTRSTLNLRAVPHSPLPVGAIPLPARNVVQFRLHHGPRWPIKTYLVKWSGNKPVSRNRGGSPHPLLGTGPFGFEDAGSRAPKRLGDATACATGSFLEAIEMCGRGCGPKEKPPPFSSNLDKDQS